MNTAIVTGASTGIGRAVSVELAKNDFEVYLVARRQTELEVTKKQVELAGGVAHLCVADLSSVDSINTLLADVKNKVSEIHLIANIAGIWHGKDEVYAGKDFQTFDQKVIVDTLMVGTVAPALIVHGLLPLMKEGSKVINLSGTFENGAKGWLPYYVSKRAIEDFTVGLAQELESRKIQVNCISPSDTATDSYSKFFPEYIEESQDPLLITKKFVELSDSKNTMTGKIIVMKKDEEPKEVFHF